MNINCRIVKYSVIYFNKSKYNWYFNYNYDCRVKALECIIVEICWTNRKYT